MNDEGRLHSAPASVIDLSRDHRTRSIAIPAELRDGLAWRYNRRCRLRCECGSGRPTLFLIEAGDRNREVCGDCSLAVWFEELNLWELRLAEFRSEIAAVRRGS